LFSAAIALSMVMAACTRPSSDSDKDAEPRRDSGSVDTADPPPDDTEESDPRDCWGPPERDTGRPTWDTGEAGDTDTGPAPVGAEPTHAASDLLISSLHHGTDGCAPATPAEHDGRAVVQCGADLYVYDYRAASIDAIIASKVAGFSRPSRSADVDGDGWLDVMAHSDSGGAWVIWGPVNGSVTVESSGALEIPETDESGSLGYTMAAVDDGSGVVQLGVQAYGSSGYVDGRVYLFEGGSRASSPLDIADAEAQILPAHGDDVEYVFNAGDFDGDGFTDLATVSPSYWESPANYDNEGGYGIHLGPVTGTVDVDDGAVWMPTGTDADVYFYGEGAQGGDVDGDGYDDALVSLREDPPGTDIYQLCLVGGAASHPGEVETCAEAGSARVLVSEDGGGGFAFTDLEDLDGDGRAEVVSYGGNVEAERRIWVMSGPVSGVMYIEEEARAILGPGEYSDFGGAFEVVSDETGPVIAVSVEMKKGSALAFLDASGL